MDGFCVYRFYDYKVGRQHIVDLKIEAGSVLGSETIKTVQRTAMAKKTLCFLLVFKVFCWGHYRFAVTWQHLKYVKPLRGFQQRQDMPVRQKANPHVP